MNARQRRKHQADPTRQFLAGLRARGVKVHRMDRSAPEVFMLRAWAAHDRQLTQGRRLVQAALKQGKAHFVKLDTQIQDALYRRLVRESEVTFKQWMADVTALSLRGYGTGQEGA